MNGQKMETQELNGECSFCGDTFPKAAMTNHLKSCKQRKIASMKPSYGRKSKLRDKRIFHLVVEGSNQPEYWMHLDVPADAKLEDLDGFLRETWVECCGHLSAFTIGNLHYERETGGVDAMWPMIFGRGTPPRNMNIRTGSVLHAGLKFHYEYDFGTTTHLELQVLSEREENIKDKSIQILAKNDPPQIICEMCGRLATQVCTQCIYEGKGWLCDKCAQEHKCGEDMLLPVVNSPRVGMCGYTGE
ncbi:MAG: hypothetical protein QMC80_07015 [Thermoplasmatales archaeon]|nr:hypothetical protein [Thermoplasmatales archaeon]